MLKHIKNIFTKSRSLEDGFFFNEIETIIGFKPKSLINYKKEITNHSTNKLD